MVQLPQKLNDHDLAMCAYAHIYHPMYIYQVCMHPMCKYPDGVKTEHCVYMYIIYSSLKADVTPATCPSAEEW